MKRAAGLRLPASAGILIAIGCGRAPVRTCADDLSGAWRDESGERWMVLDHGDQAEAYPVFADSVGTTDALGAPREIQFHRAGGVLTGEVARRFGHRTDLCIARAPLTARCGDDELDVRVAELATPTAFAPCSWSPPAMPRDQRWHRE